jgi:hypothetical protein
MPLIDLKTDLKSIKYGHDRPGGGNSGQPYITNDINNPKNTLGFDDGLIRGGAIGAAKHSISDTLRIGKFLTDAPQGPLFIAKQVGLQLSNPKIETRKITLNNGGGILGFLGNALNSLNNTLGPTRIYNLGINTIAQIPVEAFGGHFTRHGLLPVQTDASKYEAVVKSNNENNNSKNNRLVGLATKFQLGKKQTNFINTNTFKLVNAVTGLLNQTIGLSIPTLKPTQLTIDDYISGPGSVYGIGSTLINRYSFTADSSAIKLATAQSSQYAGRTRNDNGGPIAINYGVGIATGSNALSNYDFPQVGSTAGVDQNVVKYGLPFFGNPALKTYAALQKQIEKQNSDYSIGYKNTNPIKLSSTSLYGVIGDQLPKSKQNPQYKNYYGDIVKINMPWDKVTRELRVGSGRQDQINLTPIFNADAGTHNDEVNIPGVGKKNINDLVKFRIQALNTDNPSNADWMIFRAYITQISDSVDAQWSDIKYAGRGEKFYIYDGFSRKMTVGFKVAALSAQEMQPMYQKLNYLMGNLMPDYSGIIMRGPLMRMTIGNYIDGQLCKLDSLSYSIPQDSPWEIAINEPTSGEKILILPHIIEVTLSFTPIGSQTASTNKIPSKSFNTSHIAQNYNEESTNQYITGNIKAETIPTPTPPPPPKQNGNR